MSDADFDQDPEDSSPEVEPDEDLTDPNYHAPNRCDNPDCCHPNCDTDGEGMPERYPGEDIWWKTHDNWKTGLS